MSKYLEYDAAFITKEESFNPTMKWIKNDSISYDPSAEELESVRLLLGDKESNLSDDQVKLIWQEAERQLSPEEMEFLKGAFSNIGKGLKNFGKKALPVAGKLAQIAAPIAGTIIGGPVGAKIGGVVSKGIGALMKKSGGQTGLPQPLTNVLSPANLLPANIQLLQPQQPAANQLLGLLQNPAFMQSLMGQVLGGRGQGTVQLSTPGYGGFSNIPFSSFMNLLGQLTTQAAVEANNQNEDEPTYLYDAQGEFAIEDPASSEARADLLLEILQENTLSNYQFPETVKWDPMT